MSISAAGKQHFHVTIRTSIPLAYKLYPHILIDIQIIYANAIIIIITSDYHMVLAPDFERQNISLVTERRLRSALTSFGLWPRSRCSVTKEILKPFEN
jgi:hypothetical protein